MSVKQKIMENPMVSSFTGLILIVGLIMGSVKAVQDIDGLVLTHAEAAVIHLAMSARVDVIAEQFSKESKLSKCRWLSDKLDRLRYEIYTLERDNASTDFIQSKKKDLRNLERDFNALGCAKILA